MPPSEPPRASRSKPRRRPRTAAGAIPGVGAVVRPSRPARPPRPTARETQQAAAHARPLARRPVRPKPVRAPRAAAQVPGLGEAQTQRTQRVTAGARPLSQQPTKPKPISQRRRAVDLYDQLSHADKRKRAAQAQRRVSAGKDTVADRAILHAHTTRVAGSKKIATAVQAFNVLKGEQIGGRASKTLEIKPGTTVRAGTLYNPKGERVRKLEAYKRPTGGTVANLPSVAKVVATLGPVATKGLEKTALPKIIKNIPRDLAENVVTSPSSVAKFAVDVVKHPEQAGKALAKPYKQLAKDPAKFITERPATTVFMLEPGRRLPGRAVGKAARLAGKQTLERPAATLAHTALREERVGSKAAGRRAVQARKDRRAPAPEITARDIDRRVDESYAAGQKHAERVRSSILREAKKEAKKRPKAERKPIMEVASEEAGKAISARKRRRYAEEFGATARVEGGHVVEQPAAAKGHIHDSLTEAHTVKEHLNAQDQTIRRGSGSIFEGGVGAKLYPKEKLPVKYTVRDAGFGKYAVMPEQVAKRLNVHGRIGTEKAVPAVILRQSRRALTRAVLPTRPTWLSGQSIEGTARSAVAGAGPTSWMRAHRYQTRHPDLYKALAERATPGGQIGHAAAREMAHRTLAQEIPESQVARAFTELGQKPGVKQIRNLHDAYVRFVFDRVNGKVLEGIPQKALLGRAMKQHPLMGRRVLGLTNKAIDEFARGQKGTATHVALAREVERSYGKYAAFSPRLRSLIMHWTPFIPWYINSAKFLLQTLPRDHPLATGLIADINAAEEDWRKEQGLSLRYRSDKSLPPWMLGGYPIQGGKNLARLGHYLPGGSETDPVGSLVSQVLPQFSGAYGALRYGKDWKGDDLKHADGTPYNSGERVLYSAAQLIESMVPFTAQGAQAAGIPEVLGGPSESDTSTARQRAWKQVRPISTVPVHREAQSTGVQIAPVKVKPVKVRPVKVKPIQTGS